MDRMALAFIVPIGVTAVVVAIIFAVSRILLVFNDQAIATAVALAMALVVLGVSAFLARGSSASR